MLKGMKIGIDARALAVPPAGIEVYTRNLLRAFAALRPDLHFVLYTTKDFHLPFDGNFRKRLGEGGWARKGSLWMQIEVPRLCARDRLDLFWSPLQTLPVSLPRTLPAVLTIHDFVQYYRPESMKFGNWLLMKVLGPPSWRRADAFITGSRHVEKRIRKIMGPGREVRVIPHGPMALPKAVNREGAREWIRSALGFEGPYILAVGTLEPRKNLGALFQAVAALVKGGTWRHRLVLAGGTGWKAGNIFKTVETLGLSDQVVFSGPVSDEDLARLYAGADLFVYPSLYEGFGLPVLEAMALGVPVAASRASSLPEVLDDAGVLFDPRHPGEIAGAIHRVLSDDRLRADLVQRGLVRASQFSWEKAGAETLDVFERTVSHAPSAGPHAWTALRAEAEHFNRISRAFLRNAPAPAFRVTEPTSWETSMVRDAFAFLGDLRGSAFLDVGCGQGHNAIFAAKEGARIAVGFDIARESLRIAVRKAAENGVAAKAFFVVARAERLPFKNGKVDRLLGTGILHHVSIPEAGRELRRILAPGAGRGAFTEPLGDNPVAQWVRTTVGYPRKCRTPRERPLRRGDIETFLRPFPGGEARAYYLLTALQRALRGYFPTGTVDRLDRKILNALPRAGRFAAQVLLLVSMDG
jgi:glycosyltransferase involved in cell wall biosynthesis/ubiquinone/menaquinone biosynthesis C-methylase UbiE